MHKTKGKDRGIKKTFSVCFGLWSTWKHCESAIFVVLLYVKEGLFSAFKVFKVENPSAAFHHALCWSKKDRLMKQKKAEH